MEIKSNRLPYALWLTAWFPTRKSPLNGDFILRHALATSSFVPVMLIHVEKDTASKRMQKEIIINGQCTFIKIYYPSYSHWEIVDTIISVFLYLWYCIRECIDLINKNGKPKAIHVHVAQKSLIAGWLLSLAFHKPLILSEHSGRFLPEGEDSYFNLPFLKKRLFCYLLKIPKNLTAVSAHLASSIVAFSGRKTVDIIPNVVDETLFSFSYPPTQLQPFRIIHISNFTSNKNLPEILEAVELSIKQYGCKVELTIVGPISTLPEELRKKKPEWLKTYEEMDQSALSKLIKNNHALVLYSDYETFGCVVIEALSCGRPVLVSNIPSLEEICIDNTNGYLIEKNKPEALAYKIVSLIKNYHQFSPAKLHTSAVEKYSFNVIGRKIAMLYE